MFNMFVSPGFGTDDRRTFNRQKEKHEEMRKQKSGKNNKGGGGATWSSVDCVGDATALFA